MKKLLFVLSFLCSALMINAQVLNVSGIVSDSTGGPVSGVQIEISAPVLGLATPIGYATTNANGSYFWMDTIGIMPIMGTGILDVAMVDCNGAYVTQSLSYSPNVISLTANFTFCLGGSGGGGSGNCAVTSFSFNDSINPMIEHFVAQPAGGTAPYAYLWDFGDGTTATSQLATHTYAQSGTYNACVTVTDANGCSATSCNFINIVGNPGGGNCIITLSPGTVSGNQVSFSATLTGSGSTGAAYYWDMGDGTTYSTQTITHTYAQSGTYTLCVLGTNNTFGCIDTSCVTIFVNGGGGTCSTSLLYYPDSMNQMTHHFTANNSGTAPYTYAWDFGDGNMSTSASPSHTYTQNGVYTACVTITDANGCTATDCQQITVGGIWGCTVITSHYVDTLVNGLTAHFSAAASPVVGGITYHWDFGDGNTSTAQNPTHTYSQAGVYTACVIAVDSAGCAATSCEFVVVGNFGNCTAYMNYIADSTNSMTHYFNVQASGGAAPYTYLWDFGDGSVSTQATPTHTYTQNGTYYVCVTVTDANGCQVTDCVSIYVFGGTPCSTSFTSSTTAANPSIYTFSSVNANSANILYLWDFGDGNSDSTGGIVTHTYAQAGTYVACLLEIDMTTGCFATYCDTIIVAGGAACQAAITYNNNIGSLTVDFFGSATPAAVSYAWDFGDGNASTAQNPTHTYSTSATGPVTYTVTLTTTDASGCTATATETLYLFGGTNSGQIMGYMWKDTLNFTSADGLVYLIEYDSISGTLTAIDTVQTQQGFFDFQNVPMGLYLVKGALLPSDPDYANYLPTYFIQSLSWNNAQYVSPAPFGIPAFIDIQLVAGNNPGGPGFIGGLVVSGAGRPVNDDNLTLVENINNAEPIEGASVLLLDANHNAVTHTVTDEDGAYSFSNIAMGTYYVHVEEVGKVTFPANVTVDGNNMNHTAVHFTVHDEMVTLTGTYDVVNVEDFQVFPNPVRNTANVQLQLKESMDLNMTVTNLMGQQMINQSLRLNAGDNSFAVDMNDLPTGIYVLSLNSGSDVITYKIQKL